MKRLVRVLFLIFLTIAGCSSSEVRVEEQNRSLNDLKEVVRGLMGEPKKISENGREFVSQYFSPTDDPKFDPNKSKRRLMATLIVLGERRPYDISIRVDEEQRRGKTYEVIGRNSAWEQKLRKNLIQRLNQGRGGRNTIDEFRAF